MRHLLADGQGSSWDTGFPSGDDRLKNLSYIGGLLRSDW